MLLRRRFELQELASKRCTLISFRLSIILLFTSVFSSAVEIGLRTAFVGFAQFYEVEQDAALQADYYCRRTSPRGVHSVGVHAASFHGKPAGTASDRQNFARSINRRYSARHSPKSEGTVLARGCSRCRPLYFATLRKRALSAAGLI